jgi:hypothetical protein
VLTLRASTPLLIDTTTQMGNVITRCRDFTCAYGTDRDATGVRKGRKMVRWDRPRKSTSVITAGRSSSF